MTAVAGVGVTWHAVNTDGRDVCTGRPPRGLGRPSPASALAATPVPAWPLAVVAGDRRLSVADALGPGGGRVQRLLDALAAGDPVPAPGGVEALARATPAGTVDLPLAIVALPAGVQATAQVEPGWLAAVDRRRTACRQRLVTAGREDDMEAALHVSMLVTTEWLDPADDADEDAHVASGARLWFLAGAVVSALSGAEPDPFEAWARLVAGGWWPIGPSGGRLVVSAATPALPG